MTTELLDDDTPLEAAGWRMAAAVEFVKGAA